MDGMSFDYDHYFSEETFVIDDFGEICEDIVRIASASSHYLCKDYDNELRHDSPPPGSFIASNRCFEKEVPSLFSEMEYLTEVSPETDTVLSEQRSVTIAVNPTEFSSKRQDETLSQSYIESFLEDSASRLPECMEESIPTPGKEPEQFVHAARTPDHLSDPTDYQLILNNYIQKGRRKLEASSYSKMKAACLAKEKMNARSTSLVETVTISSLLCQGRRTVSTQALVESSKLTHHGTVGTAIVNRLPSPITEPSTAVVSCAADNSRLTDETSSQLPPRCPAFRNSCLSRTTASPAKTARAYRCQDCNVSFPTGELLRKHTCIIAEQYQCHLCLREFKKRKTLDHHMKSHDKVFSTDDDLRK